MSSRLWITEYFKKSFGPLPLRGLKIGEHKIKTLLNYKTCEY